MSSGMNWRKVRYEGQMSRYGSVDIKSIERKEWEAKAEAKRLKRWKRKIRARARKSKGPALPIGTLRSGENGIPCPRCGLTTERRTHKAITPKELRRPFYYRQWFYCVNQECQTNMVMREEDKVYPREPVAPEPAPSKDVVLEVLDEMSDDDLPW